MKSGNHLIRNACRVLIAFQFLLTLGFGTIVAQDRDEFVITTLEDAEEIARKLPSKHRSWALSQLAREYGRLADNKKATACWEEAIEFANSLADPKLRAYALGTVAEQKVLAGDSEEALEILSQITHPEGADYAKSWVAKALSGEGKHLEAVELAESVETLNRVRFDTMEHIAVNAAKDEDVKNAARGSRGMDPISDEHSIRKIRTVCKLCMEYIKSGNNKAAKSNIQFNKKFAQILQADSHTMAMVEVASAIALGSNVEEEISRIIGEIKNSETLETRKDIYASISQLLVRADLLDFVNQLVDECVDEEFSPVVAVFVAEFYAKNGNVTATENALAKTVDFPLKSNVYVHLATALADQDEIDQARKYVELAHQQLYKDAKLADEQSIARTLRSLAIVMSKTGQYEKANSLLKSISNDHFLFGAMIEMARANIATQKH